MNYFTKNTDQRGFTLLEIMISLAIFALGILGIVNMHMTAISSNASAVKFTEATLASQCQIESQTMASYDTIDNTNASTSDGYTVVTNADDDVIPVGYTLEWRLIQEIDMSSPADGVNDLKEINVRVRDPNGKIRSDLTFRKARVL